MRPKNTVIAAACALVAAALAVGCGSKKPRPPMEPSTTETQADAGTDAAPPVDAAPPAPKSLFERLGGKDGIAKIVDSVVKNVTADADLKKSFAKTTGPRADAFKKNLTDQLCEIAGGDCKYAGKDMKTAHKGMHVNEKQWDAFVKDLTAALDENQVGDNEKNELFALLAPMHDDVVGKK
jgi:hemoglobin